MSVAVRARPHLALVARCPQDGGSDALKPLIAAGYHLIPLHKPHAVIDGRERGKSPLHTDWTRREYDTDEVLSFAAKGHNIGVALGPRDLVVDYDPRNDPGGDALVRLQAVVGDFPADVPRVRTGGGGEHYYFKLPEEMAGARIRNELPEFPGVEFKSLGRQVVAPGSIHPNGTPYRWDGGFPDVVPLAPTALLGMIVRTVEEAPAAFPGEPELTGDDLATLLAQLDPVAFAEHGRWLEILMAAHASTGGAPDAREAFIEWSTGDPVYIGHDEMIRRRWDSLDARGGVTMATLMMRVKEAGGSGLAALAPKAVEEDWPEVEPAELPEALGAPAFEMSRGKPAPTLRNAIHAVKGLGVQPRYDSFRHRIQLAGGLSALRERFPDVRPLLNDAALTAIEGTILASYRLELPPDKVYRAVQQLAHASPFDSLRDALDALAWDGQPRTERFLAACAGAEDTAYTRAVSGLFFLGAVARAYQPGVKVDSTLVLEGPQGCGKSSLVRILGGEFTAEGLPAVALGTRDSIDAMQGRWLIELEELAAMRRQDVESLKAFLSRTEDRARLAYARATSDFPRRCVFVGTTNDSAYLRDHTGNRRFLPVGVKGIDLAAVARDRDQLWAEAAASWKRDPRPERLVLPADLWGAASAEQEARREEDPWEELVAKWLAIPENQRSVYATTDLLEQVVRKPRERMGQQDYGRLRAIMGRLGFEHGSFHSSEYGKTVRGYRRRE